MVLSWGFECASRRGRGGSWKGSALRGPRARSRFRGRWALERVETAKKACEATRAAPSRSFCCPLRAFSAFLLLPNRVFGRGWGAAACVRMWRRQVAPRSLLCGSWRGNGLQVRRRRLFLLQPLKDWAGIRRRKRGLEVKRPLKARGFLFTSRSLGGELEFRGRVAALHPS